ncbi:hypothetical protein ACIQOV_03625, partial [Kitasatospora sp. NPDC091257]|uniref:hypothetical protein n=1 Tax=Kitasatospora sp. NPDC091257 TaxID=3364084 RepID=UPI00380B5855
HYGTLSFDIARMIDENPELGRPIHEDGPDVWPPVGRRRDGRPSRFALREPGDPPPTRNEPGIYRVRGWAPRSGEPGRAPPWCRGRAGRGCGQRRRRRQHGPLSPTAVNGRTITTTADGCSPTTSAAGAPRWLPPG